MTKYSDNALAIYKRLYFDETKGETRPEEVHERVANFIGDNDNEKQDFLDLMNDKTFRPNSPCLINAGRISDKNHDRQLAACFTIGLNDSMDSIIDMWSVCAKIYASGAGSGIPITNLREAGSPINSGGYASGSLAYMKVIDLLSDTVRSGGRTRRASNLASFKYNHPETIQIIESKENKKSLKNFNLSMIVDNTFMDSIINKENINFPIRSPNKNKKTGKRNNIELWNKITDTAWKCGDPGLLFIDIVNQFNPLPSYGNIDVTNPCVSGDTLLLTKDGYEEIQNLINKEVEIWNGYEWSLVTPMITGYNQEMLTIIFDNNEKLICTKYHRFKLKNGNTIEAKELYIGAILINWYTPDGKHITNTTVTNIVGNTQIEEKVYCFKEPIRGMGMFNDVVTMQCGEVPLPPWSVCNLGSLNLNSFIRKDQIGEFFSYDAFRMAIRTATRFLDNVIDKTSYLHPNFEKMSKATRPFGLGIMAFADILVKLNIPYGSDESIKFFKELCYFLTKEAIITSIELAKEKGTLTIPNQDYKHFTDLLNYYTQYDHDSILLNDFGKYGIRNSTWTCLPPTGSISLSADCSYAWEPLMALVWEKPLTDTDQVLKIIHPEFEKDLDKQIMESTWKVDETNDLKEYILSEVIKHRGSIQHINYFPQEMKDKYKVAHDINPINKIEMQSEGQKFISMAISSTCNLPNNATVEDVDKIFRLAYQKGLKGITVFRDRCLSNQPVNFGKVEDKQEDVGYVEGEGHKADGGFIVIEDGISVNLACPDEVIKHLTREESDRLVSGLPKKKTRPIKRSGDTVEVQTPYGKLFTTCNFDNNKKPLEIFFRVGKQGASTNVLIDALGRVCSKALQDGSSLEHLADTLRGLKGEKFWFKVDDGIDRTESAESIVDAISIIMEHHWINNKPEEVKIVQEVNECEYEECPECHRKSLRHDGGCRGGYCPICGYSNCG